MENSVPLNLLRWRLVALLIAGLYLRGFAGVAFGAETNPPAVVKVAGFGFLGNREMVRLLQNFQSDRRKATTLDRTFVEDSALVLFSRAESLGYLHPRLRVKFTLPDGSSSRLEWTNALDIQLPQGFVAKEARFRLHGGARSYYQHIEIKGITAFSQRQARGYFVTGDTLLSPRASRAFSPETLRNSLAALKEALVRNGYREAAVTASQVTTNAASGAVQVEVTVEEGLPTLVRSVAVAVDEPGLGTVTNHSKAHLGKPYSYLWQQDFARELQEEQFKRGHPDALVEFVILTRETTPTNYFLDLSAQVHAGPTIHLGDVHFSGNTNTRASVLESRVNLEKGELLDRTQVEKARQSLARLGVFDSVSLRYTTNADATTRDVEFDFKEGKPLALSLLAGYGSYELLRAGFEFEHRNVFGLAHDINLRASQSFKATRGEAQYTIPEIFTENLNVFLKGSGLHREEVSFTREEYGGSVGAQKRLEAIETDLSVHYDYEFLNALDLDITDTNRLGLSKARAAAFNIELNHDRRDNPLLPRQGIKLFGKFEFASEALGGQVDYQRIIVSASYHWDLGGGRLVHLGAVHGLSATLGGTPADLPFNKRFFPGGENSLRGYQDGEASPLDANGEQLGAETFTQGNFEFEQLLTRSWSLVTFIDGVGFAKDRKNYPWDEGLFSFGGGIRWRTMIGPVRLEYGRNLNPRRYDPAGTLHFSIGVPF